MRKIVLAMTLAIIMNNSYARVYENDGFTAPPDVPPPPKAQQQLDSEKEDRSLSKCMQWANKNMKDPSEGVTGNEGRELVRQCMRYNGFSGYGS